MIVLLSLSGCLSTLPSPTATASAPAPPTIAPTSAITATAAPAATATTSPYPWTDENAVMSGVCFESAYDAAGQTFIIQSPEALINFYDLADHSELCRQPVTRNRFDFRDGRILAGIWSRAQGCKAHHEVDRFVRDDAARTLFIFLNLVVEGNCAYELVRPFWIGLSGVSGYDIQFVVSE